VTRLRAMGFTPEAVGDAPAGVFGRTVAMLINEAALALSEGIASAGDIDNAMQLGVNYPKGLFEWADDLGPDLVLDMLEGLYDHYLDDRYRPAPLLRHVVAAGIWFRDL
jgi:3-hydroxybutyryl-CoA dehydrogenase